ncbi:MAG: aldehyde dehydrogenase family protein [Alphaproteobacteria bacterium]|nr:aldehyde dehydrogenase family protein [Alphaproteobacteria bacterium]MDE2110657.1 aldehyde dehydrogenase family protein [Alphaproteobacteria bacterium]
MSSVAEILQSMEYGPAPESAAPVEAWLDKHNRSFDLFIGGEWVGAQTHFDSFNPATGKKLAAISHASETDVDAAVRAARAAQPGWAKLGGAGRARHLYAIARLIQKHSRPFAVLETMDNGKPIRETRDIDVPLTARHFYHHAGWAQLLESEFPDRAPLGVAGQIVPWNFPLLILAWKIAPALAAGNTVVLKPSKETSLSALLFAEICAVARLPKGVVNIVTGPGKVGDAIVRHPGIDKIAFTGSTEVGRGIRMALAGSEKKLTLELGGKSPFVVFEDADLDGAVEGAVDAIWFNQGQVCCAGSRLLVQESVAEKFLAKLRARMETLRVGDPLDKATDIGAIVSMTQRSTIDALVKHGVAEGAEIFQPKAKCPEGCFYPPTLLTKVEPASTVVQEEIFGPVLVAMSFRTPSEAAQLSNNTRYGLAASVWSENINVALDLAPKIKAGVVWVNCTNQFDAAVGFGGYRESGFGREGGREGMFAYLKPKAAKKSKATPAVAGGEAAPAAVDGLDRTAKMFIGGKQARPDGGYSRAIVSPSGAFVGHVGEGNRKDIRNAVEAAAKAEGWAATTGHARAQILYYCAENLSARVAEFAQRIRAMTGAGKAAALREVETSIRRLFTYAAWADKYDGLVHNPPLRGVALAMNEPVGVIGIACPDEAPLLAFTSLWAPAVAMGNRVVIVPSEQHPLAGTDFYQVLETSDMPGGVVNIVTGPRDPLAQVLAEHHGVEAMWYFGPADSRKKIEEAAVDDIKQTWMGDAIDWIGAGEGREFLRHATQVKNVWIPYGA